MKNHSTGRLGGFTLIELLIVVLIIGILSAVALPQYQKAVSRTRVMSLLPLIRAINDSQQRYFMANGLYAERFDELDIQMPAGGTVGATENVLRYSNYRCFLHYDEEGLSSHSVYCMPAKSNEPSIEKYYTRDNFICWPRTHDDGFGAQLCQNISGTTIPSASSSHSQQKGYVFQ